MLKSKTSLENTKQQKVKKMNKNKINKVEKK